MINVLTCKSFPNIVKVVKFGKREKRKEKRKGISPHEQWFRNHQCCINNKKSSMESAVANEIFGRSVSQHNLIYHKYLGDGGKNSFKNVVLANPYNDFYIVPIKLECVGHV